MATAEQSRHSLEAQITELRAEIATNAAQAQTEMAQLETRMLRLILGGGMVAILGILIGVLLAIG